jgi:hypothetical protein
MLLLLLLLVLCCCGVPLAIDSFARPSVRATPTRSVVQPTLFVRTHKTGSSTLTAILHRLSDLFNAPVFVVCHTSVELSSREWNLSLGGDRLRLQRAHVRPRSLVLWSDHLVWNRAAKVVLLPRFVAAPRVITLLRHPLEQFRSACAFWSQWNCSFVDLVRQRMRTGARLRSGEPWFASHFFDQFRHFEPREAVLDAVPLITEHWELSMVALAHITGAPCDVLRVAQLKVSGAARSALLSAEQQLWLHRELADEIAEYERAVSRLHDFVAALPRAFRDDCLQAYRRAPTVSVADEAEWTRKRCNRHQL